MHINKSNHNLANILEFLKTKEVLKLQQLSHKFHKIVCPRVLGLDNAGPKTKLVKFEMFKLEM